MVGHGAEKLGPNGTVWGRQQKQGIEEFLMKKTGGTRGFWDDDDDDDGSGLLMLMAIYGY